jgi:hypothetical protein
VIRMNHAFVSALTAMRGWRELQLDVGLATIVNEGIIRRSGGCFLLSSAANLQTNATVDRTQDQTGYECFVNHIHIDDHVPEDAARQAICFAAAVLDKWHEQSFEGVFNSIVTVDGDEATVRFHFRRPKEFWLAQGVDEYEEAVLEISSSDRAFLSLLQ